MNLYIGINLALVIFYLFMFYKGFKTGFFLQLANMLGMIAAFFISSYISPVLADYIKVWPKNIELTEYQFLNSLFYEQLNKFLWYIIVFVVICIFFALLKPAIKFLQKIPLIKQLSSLLGGIFGIIIANIWVLFAIFILSMPVIKDGLNIVQKTYLKDIKNINEALIGDYIKPLLETEMFTKIMVNFDSLNDDDKLWLMKWLENNGIKDINLEEFYSLK